MHWYGNTKIYFWNVRNQLMFYEWFWKYDNYPLCLCKQVEGWNQTLCGSWAIYWSNNDYKKHILQQQEDNTYLKLHIKNMTF